MVILSLLGGYLIGSIPFGLMIVRLFTGQDLRTVGSGRTGGTNAMRAGGALAGILTALLDVLKAAGAVWLARRWTGNAWAEVGAALTAILGHNYSVFMKFRGGAGGAPTVGGALAMWPPAVLIVVPFSVLVFHGVGYASVTTLVVALMVGAVFAVRTLSIGELASPWAYAVYGPAAFAVVAWALRPNILRLLNGTERRVGWRARRQARAQASDQSPST